MLLFILYNNTNASSSHSPLDFVLVANIRDGLWFYSCWVRETYEALPQPLPPRGEEILICLGWILRERCTNGRYLSLSKGRSAMLASPGERPGPEETSFWRSRRAAAGDESQEDSEVPVDFTALCRLEVNLLRTEMSQVACVIGRGYVFPVWSDKSWRTDSGEDLRRWWSHLNRKKKLNSQSHDDSLHELIWGGTAQLLSLKCSLKEIQKVAQLATSKCRVREFTQW